MVSAAAPQSTIRLSDYTPYPFRIPAIDLNVVVGDEHVTVTAAFQVEPWMPWRPRPCSFAVLIWRANRVDRPSTISRQRSTALPDG